MRKTAIMQLIDKYQQQYNSIQRKCKDNYTHVLVREASTLKMVIDDLRDLLETEKQQIIEAYDEGYYCDFGSGESYFNTTFQK